MQFAIEQKRSKFLNPDSIEDIAKNYIRYETAPWKFNQIVGFVELTYEVGGIKAYYSWVDAKRVAPSMARKKFHFCGKLVDVSRNPTKKRNSEIRKDVRLFIKNLPMLRQRFKQRYFDVGHVEAVIDYVDFSKLLQSLSENGKASKQ